MDEESLKAAITIKPPSEPTPDEAPDNGLLNATTQEYEELINNANKSEEDQSVLGWLYTFNTYNTGMIDDDGKATFNDSTPEAQDRFNSRIDNFIGLMHILKNNSYKDLDQKLSIIRNELFFNKSNASILEKLRQVLKLQGELKIQYALKSSAGRRINKDSRYYRYDQGDDEKLSYLYSDAKDADKVSRKNVVAIISQNNVPILEIPTATLNSPLTIINRVDSKGQPIYPGLYKVFWDTLKANEGKPNAEYLAREAIISTFNGKVDAEQQRIIDLLQIYRFTSNGIFFFQDDFNLASQHSTGIHLTYAKGQLQLNDSFITTNNFIPINELAKHKQLSISRVMLSRNGLINRQAVVNVGHPFVLVGNSNNFTNTNDLYNQFVKQINDPTLDKEVQLFYVIPPKATVQDWFENQHNLGIRTAGLGSPEVYNIGNELTGYRIFSSLSDEVLNKYPSVGSTALNYITSPEVLTTVREIVNQGKQIEAKWQNQTLNLDNNNKIGTRGELELYDDLRDKYGEEQARKLMATRELRQFLNTKSGKLYQEDRTKNQVINAYLACMVWNRNSSTSTTKNEDALKAIIEDCNNKGVDGVYYKTSYSSKEVGEFTEIQQLDGFKLKGVKGDSLFRINARIDTPAFNTDMLPLRAITNQMYFDAGHKVWRLKDGEPKAKEAWYLSNQTNPQPSTNSFLDTYRSYIDKGIFTEQEVLMAEHQANQKEELVRIYNNKGEGRFGFIYNDQIVLTQNKDYTYIQDAPITLSTADNPTLWANKPDMVKPVRLTFVIETDADGNVSSVNAKETSYQKVEVTQQDGVDKDLFTAVSSQLTISAGNKKFFKFWQYLADTQNGFEQFSKLKRYDMSLASSSIKQMSSQLTGKLKTKFETLISQLKVGSKIVVNLKKGNIVYQNKTRYTIIEDNSLKAVDDNGNEVILNQDDLEKEITPCNLINWKIKL